MQQRIAMLLWQNCGYTFPWLESGSMRMKTNATGLGRRSERSQPKTLGLGNIHHQHISIIVEKKIIWPWKTRCNFPCSTFLSLRLWRCIKTQRRERLCNLANGTMPVHLPCLGLDLVLLFPHFFSSFRYRCISDNKGSTRQSNTSATLLHSMAILL